MPMSDTEHPGSKPLKGPREVFAHAVVKLNDQSKAYREAYKVRPNTKQKSVWERASKVASDDKVASRIEFLRSQVAAEAVVDAAWVLKRLMILAGSDIRTLLDEQGNVKDVSDWPDDAAATVAGISISEMEGGIGMIKSIKRVDQLKALELLGKHKAVQAFKEQIEVSASEDLTAAIIAARKRAASGE